MFLSRLKLDVQCGQVVRDLRDVNALHQRVLAGFPQKVAAEHPREALGVLFRLDRARDGRLTLLVQSSAPPDWSSLPAGYLVAPTAFDDEGPNPAIKVLDEQFAHVAVGQKFRFRLRANPTKKVDTKTGADGRRRNGRRVALNTTEDRLAWLARKGEQHGFSVLDAQFSNGTKSADVLDVTEGRAVGARVNADGKERSPVSFGSTVFEGRLAVREVEAFVSALKTGVGSGKAFGFGLLSIAPVG